VAVGLAGSCLWPTTLGVAADLFPQGGASMFGLLAAFGNLGGILMPWLVGVTSDWSSLRLGLATSTTCPLLMAFVLLWMQRRPAAEFMLHHTTGVCLFDPENETPETRRFSRVLRVPREHQS